MNPNAEIEKIIIKTNRNVIIFEVLDDLLINFAYNSPWFMIIQKGYLIKRLIDKFQFFLQVR